MGILIDKMRVKGFRGIKNLEIGFTRMTVLFGTNNCGKTSVLKALQLAVGDYSRYLSEEDLYISSTEIRVSEIIVDVRIIAVDDNYNRIDCFNEEWAAELGDKIKSEPNGNQFIALRTRAKPNLIKGGFEVLRFTLDRWPYFDNWQTERLKESPVTARIGSIDLLSIDAQRDIHQDLKERSSFIYKLLLDVDYEESDIHELETLIKKVNDEALNKSNHLQSLKRNYSACLKS